MATDPLGLLLQLPGNVGDTQGMRRKAGQLDCIAGNLTDIERAIATNVDGTAHYQGPYADQFRDTMRERRARLVDLVQRVGACRQRLARAAAVTDSVADEVNGIRRRIERDATMLDTRAEQLVRDAQDLVEGLRHL